MSVDRVLVAEPRGFCAGVEMAIKALGHLLRLYGPPVHCYHHIVHNDAVVEAFERAGVVFVDDVADVPDGAVLMLSAHGTAPAVKREAAVRARVLVDAVCPLVQKVHHEVRSQRARGLEVVYVGHAGHDEVVATLGIAADGVHLVASPADVAALDTAATEVALASQTTLSLDEWADVRDAVLARFDLVHTPAASDVCFATTNRQRALQAMLPEVDAVVVVGSASSSNTAALAKVAQQRPGVRVVRVDGADELPADLAGVVGVTAGASAPEHLVEEVVGALLQGARPPAPAASEEWDHFPLPPELRTLLGAEVVARDRRAGAADVLDLDAAIGVR